jgi:outer membrane immunogenic protein
MPYVTGGAVWGQHSIDGPFANSANYWTWTVGGGVEGMITNRWSTKLEYLYMGTPSVPVAGPGATSNSNLIRVGVNYHF